MSAPPESPASAYTDWAARLFDPSGRHAKPEALRGIRVLDLSVIIFGPATADFLGELGAEVIKVEMPGQGDVTRMLGHQGCFWKGVSVAFFPQNHGKYHVGVDMHHAEGQALIRQARRPHGRPRRELQARHDRGEVGTGYRQLREINPAADLRREHGVRPVGAIRRGPRVLRRPRPGRVGALRRSPGSRARLPIKSGNYLGDWFGACLSALGVLAALRWRDRTGEGQFVEMAQCEGLVRALDWTWLYAGLTGRDRAEDGQPRPGLRALGHLRLRGRPRGHRGGNGCGVPRADRVRSGRPDLADDPRFESAESRRRTAPRGRARR